MTFARSVIVTAGWATIGLLVGHVAAYDVVYPDAHVHATALEASGHGWLVAMGPTLVISFLAVIAAALVGARSQGARVARFRTLAVVQAGAFVAIEVGERLATGRSPMDVGHELVDHGFWLILVTGVVCQVITAWLGSAASRGIARATASAPPPHHPRRSSARLSVPAPDDGNGRWPLLLRRSRAPPPPAPSHAPM